jgi:hypothetical protein
MAQEDIEMSELEREFELEMDEGRELGEDKEYKEDQEIEEEFEFLQEESEIEEEFEEPMEEYEGAEDRSSYYAERFYEISEREFESESELEMQINDVLNEMEREYFWGKLKKLGKKAFKGLVKKGMGYVKGMPAFQAIKGVTQLARGDLKGMLGTMAKAALPAALSAIPGGAAALPALNALGFEAEQEEDASRAAWRNFAEVSREAFEYLAGNLNPGITDPMEANRLASKALQTGLRKARTGYPTAGAKRVLRVTVRPGEKVKIIVRGA